MSLRDFFQLYLRGVTFAALEGEIGWSSACCDNSAFFGETLKKTKSSKQNMLESVALNNGSSRTISLSYSGKMAILDEMLSESRTVLVKMGTGFDGN